MSKDIASVSVATRRVGTVAAIRALLAKFEPPRELSKLTFVASCRAGVSNAVVVGRWLRESSPRTPHTIERARSILFPSPSRTRNRRACRPPPPSRAPHSPSSRRIGNVPNEYGASNAPTNAHNQSTAPLNAANLVWFRNQSISDRPMALIGLAAYSSAAEWGRSNGGRMTRRSAQRRNYIRLDKHPDPIELIRTAARCPSRPHRRSI
jgi:hypothetical protein